MNNVNEKTVFVVQIDNNKDLSDAKRYGSLRAIFGNPKKPYNTQNMVSKARKVLKDWRNGDYLLMIGDPALCAVAMAIITELDDTVNVLSWDRNSFQYVPQYWEMFNNGNANYETADD